MALEPRLLFDGAGAVAAADALPEPASEPPQAPEPSQPQPSEPEATAPEPQTAGAAGDANEDESESEAPVPASTTGAATDSEDESESESPQSSAADDDTQSGQADPDADDDTDPATVEAPQEAATLVVVDARVAEQEGFVLDVPSNVTVRVVERGESGLDAISSELANDAGRQYDTIHIISHGTPGSLTLGNEVIAGATLSDAQREKLMGWALYLTDEADILLYGCDVAEGSAGQTLITELAHLTGADIAASNDATGAAELGGNWELEVATGAIEATALTVAGFNGLLAAAPTVAITGLPAAGEVLIGEDFTFSLNFSNPGTNPNPDGYGPYIDLFLPLGADGDDGITIAASGAITYLGSAVNYQFVTLDASGQAAHPYARDPANQPVMINRGVSYAGQTVVVIELPFGSYTSGQPPAELEVTASLSNHADRGAPLDIAARAGFRYGHTPTADYATDPSVVGALVTANVTPVLVEYTHDFDHDEGETATGPNFPREMTTTITVAPGQTLTDYVFTVDVPANIVVTGVNGVPLGTPITGGGTVNHPMGTISGTQPVTIQYYVPDVLDETTGAPGTVQFQVSGTGDWDPLDARDAEEVVAYDPAGVEFEHTIRSLAVQKDVENVTDGNNSPGDTLEYTINFQVSDYHRFDNVVITDTIDDGHTLIGTPTLQLWYQGALHTIDLGGYYSDATDPGNHDIERTFDISAAVQAYAVTNSLSGDIAAGILRGGLFEGDSGGATRGQIVYQSTIDNTFDSPVAPGDAQINHGDHLATAAAITGTVIRPGGMQGDDVEDNTATEVEIASGGLTLEIVGINGAPGDGSGGISPGNTVTYELTYDLGTGDFENLQLDAFLPKPVFDVGNSADWTHGAVGGSGTYPGVGNWVLVGGVGNLTDIDGNIDLITNPATNGLSFDLGSREDDDNLPTRVVIRFTVEVNNEPFADGLHLTTQAQASENNTPGVPATHQDIIQIQLNEPHLEIRHGVVSRTEGGIITGGDTHDWIAADPFPGTITDISGIDGNITNVDAGDLVRFGVGIINTGGHGAFDISTSAIAPPPGFELVGPSLAGSNLQVRLGNGTLLTESIDYEIVGNQITLLDNGGPGLAAGRSGDVPTADGSNVLVITYDTRAIQTIAAGLDTTSTVSVVDYSNRDGGDDFLPGANVISDDATASAAAPTVEIVFKDGGITNDDSSAGHTDGADMVIGERMVYDIVVTLPEGTTHDLKVDALVPAGMRIDPDFGYQIITTAAGSGALTADFNGTVGAPAVSGMGGAVDQDPRFSFGNVTTTGDNATGNNQFVIRVQAIVANTMDNQEGTERTMGTGLVYDEGGADTNTPVAGTGAPTITVREPQLTVVKEVDTDLDGDYGDAEPAIDAGDTVRYRTTISNPAAGDGGVDAFDLKFTDPYTGYVDLTHASLTVTHQTLLGGPVDVSGLFEWNGDELRIIDGVDFDLAAGESIVITVTGVANSGVAGVSSFDEGEAYVYWSSIDSASNDDDSHRDPDERDGGDGEGDGALLNNYVSHDRARVNVNGGYVLSRVGGLADTAAPGDTAADEQDVAVGEIVRFRLVMRVPEGTIPDLNIMPNLPSGYELLDTGATWALVGSTPGSFGPAANVLIGNSADNIENTLNSGNTAGTGTRPGIGIIPNGSGVFELGDIENLDDDPDGEYLILEFNAVVSNTGINTAGHDLETTVTVRSGGTELGESNSTTDNVVEPQISPITKDVVDTAPGAQGATSTITVRNAFETGSTDAAPAYDVRLVDSFPDGANYTFESVTIGGTTYSTVGSLPAGVTFNATPGGIELVFDQLDPGTSVVVRYTTDVPTGGEQAATAPTNATVTWSSLPDGAGTISATGFAGSTVGADASASGERDGSGAGPNTYTRSDPAGYGTISGVLWDDTNDRDGNIDAGETRLAGQTVTLTWAGEDGDFATAGDNRVLTTTTNANGEYHFGALPGTGLVSGSYRITAPATVTLTTAGDEDDLTPRHDADGSGNGLGTIEVTLAEGATSVERNVGYLQVNDAPTVAITNPSVTFVEGIDRTADHVDGEDRDVLGTPVDLGEVAITDPELHRDPGQLDDFAGTTLTIGRSDGAGDFAADAEDVLGFNGSVTLDGNDIEVGGTTVGSFTNVGGQLVITFNGDADADAVNTVASAITYANSSDTPPANVTLRLRFDDANDNDRQGSGGPLSDDDTIVVNITAQNDPPVAIDNFNSVNESDGQPDPGDSTSGNVLSDNDGDGVDNDPETALADLRITEIKPAGEPGWDGIGAGSTSGAGGTVVEGLYGTLTIGEDGSYTYVLNESHPAVNSLGDGDTLTDVFDYTLADEDGLTDRAQLTITINGTSDAGGAPPSIEPDDENGADVPGDPSTEGHNTVYETGLDDADDDSEITTGDIVVRAPDGIASVTIGGTTLTYDQLQDIQDEVLLPVSIDTGEGTLVITGIRGVVGPSGAPTEFVIEYEYTLNGPVTHVGTYTDDIALLVTDNKPTPDTGSGTLSIAIINDVPQAVDDTHPDVVTEGDTVTGDVLVNDHSGADGWPAGGTTVVGVEDGTGSAPITGGTGVGIPIRGEYGTLTLHADGSYTYEADPGITDPNPVDVFTYTVEDADGDTSFATLTIELNNIPDLDAALPPQVGVDGDGGINIPTAGGFVDIDGDPLTYDATDLPPGLSIDPNTGVITGTLDNSASQGGNTGTPGVYEVTVTVTDPHGQTTSQTFTYTVTNPPPVANDDTRTTGYGTPVRGNVIGGGGRGDVPDRDPDGDDLTVTQIVVNGVTYTFDPATPTHTVTTREGRLVFNRDGSYTFTPRPGFHGRVPTVAYTITDGEGGFATANLNITVAPPVPIPVEPVPPAPQPPQPPQGDDRYRHEPIRYFDDPRGPLLPHVSVSFDPVLYVHNAVVAAQNERALTGDARASSRTDLARPYETGVRVPGIDLGMDPTLFVQHAVRDSQKLSDFMSSLVDGRLSRVSLGNDRALATPELLQTDPGQLLPKPPADEAKNDAEKGAEKPAGSAAKAGDGGGVDARAAIPAGMAPSFAEQLRGGAARLPLSAARV